MRRIGFITALVATAFAAAACDDTTRLVSPEIDPQLARAGNSQEGFVTSAPPLAALLVPGTVKTLVTAGDALPGGSQLVGVPDGIGIWGGSDSVNLYLNHEISGAARVSRFVIDTKDEEIDHHEYTLEGSEGYSRLCSAEWVDAADGFPGGYFFTGEETDDGVQLAIDARAASPKCWAWDATTTRTRSPSRASRVTSWS